MLEIKDLVNNIPDGKKRAYLGQVFVNALLKYYSDYEFSQVDLDELIKRNFKTIILNDDFLDDLIFFSRDKVNSISKELGQLADVNSFFLRSNLIRYYNIEYDEDKKIKYNYDYKSKCNTPLHDFQERIRRKVVSLIFNNQKRFLIHMPTGSGKTRTAAEIILDFIRLSSSKALLLDKMKVIWIAQSSELCQQAAETIKNIFDTKATQDISFAHFYDSEELPGNINECSAIIFCGIQKLLLNFHKNEWRKVKNDTYLVIVDEAHRSVAKRWLTALDFFVEDPSVYLLGLTATPGLGSNNATNNYTLSNYYKSNKISITDENYVEIEKPIEYLTQRGFLAEIERFDIDSELIIESTDYAITEDEINFSDNALTTLSTNPKRNLSIINIIKENNELGKSILVFTCGVEHNKILKSILDDLDIKAELVDANSKDRNNVITRFKNKETKVLLNYGVLTTGFDAPKTDICIIARPISSVVMYSQMVGRILRGPKNNGNKVNSLYTIKDNLAYGDYDSMFKTFNDYYI
jgi:superfamily II DNA or RNA helicase